MGRKFATTVTTSDPNGQPVWFYRGDEAPEWAEEQMKDNPHVWLDEQESSNGEESGLEYDSYTVPQLIEIAKNRGMDLQSTKKSEVIEELEAFDASHGG